MNYLHQTDQEDPLDIDKAGYYFPQVEELFQGLEAETFFENKWNRLLIVLGNSINDIFYPDHFRVKWLQAKDIMDLGFPRLAQGIPMYQRGSYTISAYRLLDPTTSRLLISQNGVRTFEGHVKNKSELKRILILNEIPFADSD